MARHLDQHRRAPPPWGVPVSGYIPRPAVSRCPAFSHGRSRPSEARSSTRQRRIFRRHSWSLGSQQPCRSASTTGPDRPYGRATVRSRTASPAPRPRRYPSRPASTSCASSAFSLLAQAACRRLSSIPGRLHGCSWPLPVGRERRRPSCARYRFFCRRSTTASPFAGRFSASSGLPWPVDSGGPAPPRPSGGAGVACGARSHPRRPPPASLEAVPALQGARSPLRPAGCAVAASPRVVAVCPHRAARDARRETGGWRALTRRERSPGKIRQAFLGARTPHAQRRGRPHHQPLS
jgi:hypothetical protein